MIIIGSMLGMKYMLIKIDITLNWHILLLIFMSSSFSKVLVLRWFYFSFCYIKF